MQLPIYQILPMAQGGPIQITVSLLTPQVGSCRVFLWNTAQEATEIVNPNGNSLEWKFSMPDDPGVYSGSTIDCWAEIIEPSPSPGETYSIVLTISQNGAIGQVPFTGPIAGDPVHPRLSITLK